MKKIVFYLFFYTKRQLKQRSFLLLLLLLPVLVGIFSHAQQNETSTISIALYLTQEDASQKVSLSSSDSIRPSLPEVSALLDTLLKESHRIGDSSVRFYLCDNLETLENDVQTGKAECGYCIPDTLYEFLSENQKHHLIQVVASPATTLSNLTNEILYASLFREYALYTLQTYLVQESPFSAGALLSEVASNPSGFFTLTADLYHRYLTDGSTFCFSYDERDVSNSKDYNTTVGHDTGNENELINTSALQSDSMLLSPIRGLIALFIMIAGFCGGYFYYNDKENHVYDNRTYGAIHRLQALSILIPTALISMMGLFCLYASHKNASLPKEIGSLLAYDFLVILVLWLLLKLFKNKLLFVSCIPVFVLGSCVFTPIFVDITAYLPMLKPLQYLFLPYYYLM